MFSQSSKGKSHHKTSSKAQKRQFADVFSVKQGQKPPQNIIKSAKTSVC